MPRWHDLLPFRIGESKYFQKFISAFKPDYVIPSRTKISQCLVPELAQEIQEKLIQIFRQLDITDVRTLDLHVDSLANHYAI